MTTTTRISALAKPLCTLIIDGDAYAADGLASLCERLGHEVDLAFDAAAGLEAARRLLPDIVFIAHELAGIGALELVRRLRADPTLAMVRLIGVGADPEPGFDAHLGRPVDTHVLKGLLG